jgi:alanine racemase
MDLRPNRVKIDLSALAHNLGQVKSLARPGTKIMGVVKSDAYGHGLLPVSRTLEANQVDCLGVASLHEALVLKDSGVKSRILVLSGVLEGEEIREVVARDLIPLIFDPAVAQALSEESVRQNKRTPIHVKVDTGMGRLGIPHDQLAPFLEKIRGMKSLRLEGLASHLSSADDPSRDFTEQQIRRFQEAVEKGRAMGLPCTLNHLANSAGVMSYPDSHCDLLRPGIMLYGGLPSPDFKSAVPLRPVMSFTGRVLQVRDLPGGTPISYGRTYHTQGPRRVAVLSAGYGDGLPRTMSNRGRALLKGKRVPLVGTICMNLTVCDVSHLQDVRPGDEAVFLGAQGRETILADDLARWSETISYEVLCSIGQRNERRYVS